VRFWCSPRGFQARITVVECGFQATFKRGGWRASGPAVATSVQAFARCLICVLLISFRWYSGIYEAFVLWFVDRFPAGFVSLRRYSDISCGVRFCSGVSFG
jgi:hypothetical protein